MQKHGTWKVINQLRETKTDHDYAYSADVFNEYFCSIVNESHNLDNLVYANGDFLFRGINKQELFNIWKSMKKKYNTSSDNHGGCMKMLFYTIYAPNVYDALLDLINLSISSNVYFNCFKTSTVIPIPKMVSPQDVSHYRPISLQSQL